MTLGQSKFHLNFFSWRKLLYNVVVVSAIYQHEPIIIIWRIPGTGEPGGVAQSRTQLKRLSSSCICIYIYPLSLEPLPPQFHPFRSPQSTRLGCLCYTASHQLFILPRQCIYVNVTFSIYPTLSFPLLCPPDHSLHLHLHFFSVNRFISTIFLDSIYIYIHINIQYLFFSF